jgi:hypothetical protein
MRIEQERIILHYWSDHLSIQQDPSGKQTRVEDIQSRTEEIQEIQDDMLEGHTKVIRHARKEELILEQHINNYVGGSTADFLADITHGEEETEEVDMAFDAFMKEEA